MVEGQKLEGAELTSETVETCISLLDSYLAGMEDQDNQRPGVSRNRGED